MKLKKLLQKLERHGTIGKIYKQAIRCARKGHSTTFAQVGERYNKGK